MSARQVQGFLTIAEMQRRKGGLRREVATFARENGNVDIIPPGYLAHETGQPVVKILGKGIEFLGHVESNDGNFALG